MSSSEIISLLVGLILGVIGNYIFEAFGFKQRAAKLSKKRAEKRRAGLKRELSDVERIKAEPSGPTNFLLGRLFLINVLWITQEGVDYLFGLGANTTSAFYSYIPPLVISGISAIGSAFGALWLFILANIGYRTYRKWRYVQDFDSYKPRIQAEIEELEAVMSAK